MDNNQRWSVITHEELTMDKQAQAISDQIDGSSLFFNIQISEEAKKQLVASRMIQARLGQISPEQYNSRFFESPDALLERLDQAKLSFEECKLLVQYKALITPNSDIKQPNNKESTTGQSERGLSPKFR